MELESLKYIWHSLEAPPALEQDRQTILDLIHRKSQAPVSRMRRNLVGEGILLLLAYTPATIVFLLAFDGRLAAIAWLYILLAGFFFIYYVFKYRLLSKMQCPTCQLRSNLARQVDMLKKYVRFYLVAGTAMIPITYFLACMMADWKLANPVLWLTLLVPITVGMYFINASYINRLYGRHIKKLQELLHELDSE
jgi:hypothetical protein